MATGTLTHLLGEAVKGTPLETVAGAIYYRVFGPRRVTATVNDRTFEFDARSNHEFTAAPDLDGELEVVEATLDRMDGGDRVWDVGANVGWHAVIFGTKGPVFAFEPNPVVYRRLQETAALTPEARVFPVALGVGPMSGVETLTTDWITGAAASPQREGGQFTRTYRVPFRTPGDIVDAGIPAPDVLKLDVEGYEGVVVDALGSLLENIEVVMIEFHDGIVGDWTAGRLRSRIEEAGLSAVFKQERDDETHYVFER